MMLLLKGGTARTKVIQLHKDFPCIDREMPECNHQLLYGSPYCLLTDSRF